MNVLDSSGGSIMAFAVNLPFGAATAAPCVSDPPQPITAQVAVYAADRHTSYSHTVQH